MFFFCHSECNIQIEVNALKVQCSIDSFFPLAKSHFKFSEGYEFIDNYFILSWNNFSAGLI